MRSLYGRTQDRLSHVLIDAGYEGLRDFYYPTPVSSIIIDRNGQELDASKAQVSLADIPFIRLRDDLPGQLIQGKQSFRETIETMRLIEEPLLLDFGDVKERIVYCSGMAVKFTPVDYAFYYFIVAETQLKSSALARIPFKDEPDENYGKVFIECLMNCYGQPSVETEQAMEEGMTHEYFSERVSRVNKLLKTALGNRVASPYLIKVRGKHGSGLYGIDPTVFEDNE